MYIYVQYITISLDVMETKTMLLKSLENIT